jgi:hypothetical protein
MAPELNSLFFHSPQPLSSPRGKSPHRLSSPRGKSPNHLSSPRSKSRLLSSLPPRPTRLQTTPRRNTLSTTLLLLPHMQLPRPSSTLHSTPPPRLSSTPPPRPSSTPPPRPSSTPPPPPSSTPPPRPSSTQPPRPSSTPPPRVTPLLQSAIPAPLPAMLCSLRWCSMLLPRSTRSTRSTPPRRAASTVPSCSTAGEPTQQEAAPCNGRLRP